MRYETVAILNQILAHIPHILNDGNGRFGEKKEWRLLSVLCSLRGMYARENLQWVFSLQTLQCAMFLFSYKLASILNLIILKM